MKPNLLIKTMKLPVSALLLLGSFFLMNGKGSELLTSRSKDKQIKTGGYKLVWADEFNKEGRPDSANWSYEEGLVRNKELQWYQPENARCEKGKLIIEARREEKLNPNYSKGSKDWRESSPLVHYTSACLITRKHKAWQYGRFEMRARFDINEGIWPAWWTLGINGRWPANGEIDIMEYYRHQLLANIAYADEHHHAQWYSRKFNMDSLGAEKWSLQFHTWRMDWNENFIALYLDDDLVNKVPLDSLINKDGTGFNPFKQPHYMLLNLAIGGQNGGDPSAAEFPRRFEIDYVRVYQEK